MDRDPVNERRPVPAAILRLLVRPFEAFFRTEALGGTVLILATIAALVWANSGGAATYARLWSTPVTIGAPSFGLTKPLLIWVNDLLMAIFFLVVGLEIKREMIAGELNSPRKAAVPAIAALGGMVVPAGLFLTVAHEAPFSRGWGVPMATDIAFALGCLRLLGSRVPAGIVAFLAALAIIDDLGAIIVIALFYAGDLATGALGLAAVFTLVLVGMNLFGVRRPGLYILAAIPLWVAVLKSGIHPTIAGVIIGFCVPARPRYSREDVIEQAHELMRLAEEPRGERADVALAALERRLEESESPLQRLEQTLHPFVAFGVVPIFALANAGVSLAGTSWSDLTAPTSLGVILGLVLGKPIGVFGATWIAVRANLAPLPTGVHWRHVFGMSLLAGIGFTMSLFVAGLAYGEGTPLHHGAKIGVLCASFLAAVAGVLVLSRGRLRA